MSSSSLSMASPTHEQSSSVEPMRAVIDRVAGDEEWLHHILTALAGTSSETTLRRFCRAAELRKLTGKSLVEDYAAWRMRFKAEIMFHPTITVWSYIFHFIGESFDRLVEDEKKPGCCGRCHPPT